MLQAMYLPANHAWAVVYPDRSICGIGSENRHLFESKKELRNTLRRLGLTLDHDRVIIGGNFEQ